MAVTLGASYRPRNRSGDPTQLDNDAAGKVLLVNRRDTTHAVKQHDTQDGHRWVKHSRCCDTHSCFTVPLLFASFPSSRNDSLLQYVEVNILENEPTVLDCFTTANQTIDNSNEVMKYSVSILTLPLVPREDVNYGNFLVSLSAVRE